MILVPLLFIRYIFCMNNDEVQTRKGEIKKNLRLPQWKRKNAEPFFLNFDYISTP